MVDLFKVILNDQKILQYNWYCDKCSDVTIRVNMGKGHYVAEDSWPKHTPTSKRCTECGNWASFISANLIPFWNREDTGEEIFKITDYPGACYHDERAVLPSKGQKRGPDGQYLILILPNKTRIQLDARPSSCSLKSDDMHRCRIRTGSLDEGTLSLSKDTDVCEGTSEYILSDGIFYQLKNNQIIEVDSHD